MTAVISIAGGLLGGILFSKLAELAAVRIVGNHLGYKMTIEPKAIYYTVSLFLAIFAVILLRMLIFIFRTKPVDMLKSETAGEKTAEGELDSCHCRSYNPCRGILDRSEH